jgi:hypothetical protein
VAFVKKYLNYTGTLSNFYAEKIAYGLKEIKIPIGKVQIKPGEMLKYLYFVKAGTLSLDGVTNLTVGS